MLHVSLLCFYFEFLQNKLKSFVSKIVFPAVLAVLNQNPEISREEIAERVSKTVRTVQRALGTLVDKGYIRRVGAKKNSTWEVLKK